MSFSKFEFLNAGLQHPKPGVGWDSGTTANVGIRLYGNAAKSGSRHLSHSNKPFQQGGIEIFQVAVPESLGDIQKIKIWHDNTGLDPAWFLSRVIIRDLQTKERYYFLVDDWLQISPYDSASSVEKEIMAATNEEIGLFTEVFQVQRAYLKADSHLWFSIVTRPTRRGFENNDDCVSLAVFTKFP